MSYKSIFVGPMLESSIEERAPAESLVSYALELAAFGGAHLSIGVGSCKFSAPAAAVVREARDLILAANNERHEHAEALGANILTRARAAGVLASVEVVHDVFSEVATRFVQLARVSDIAVLQPSDETLSLMQGVVQDVLFESGRPVIIVPTTWNKPASLESVIVAWDGSAKAARAIGDALPLLQEAERIEIVSISGDPNPTKRCEGSEIAAHLARHCRSVSVTSLPSQNGDVGTILSNHATITRASLVVMGAYAHNQLRQFFLGGVTNTMIYNPPVPVLMSY